MANRTRISVFLLVICTAIAFFCVSLFAEEALEMNEEPAAESAVADAAETVAPAAETASPEVIELISPTEAEPAEEVRWLWAEVVLVDPAANQVKVKYLSYESDEEKELNLDLDNDTKFENFTTLSDMEVGDNLSVDYIMDKDGKATAKTISLQKSKPPASELEAGEILPPADEALSAPEAAPEVGGE